ncbi:MAG TPA: hypothetical protein VIH42_02370 [Thermoguttaceae bacterium]
MFSVLRSPICIFIILWLILMIAGRSAMFRDPGTFWHVVVGEKILSARQVPQEDTFSFTSGGQPWVADQWLAEIGMAAVHRMAGWDGLLAVTAAILAGVYTGIISRMLRAGMHWLLAVMILALALLASSHQFHVRPLVLSMAGLTITFSLLLDVETGKKPLHRLWWLVLLFILWTNMHGGVLAGMGSLAFCILGWCALWVAGTDSPITSTRHALGMIALILVSGLGVLINPYGVQLVRAWFVTLSMSLPEIIQEHRRLDLTSSASWATLGLCSIYGIVLLSTLPKRPKIIWLLPMVFFVLAVQRIRNEPLFAITASLALADMLLYSRLTKWLQHREWLSVASSSSTSEQSGSGKTPWICLIKLLAPVIVVAGVLCMQATDISLPVFGRGWARFDSTCWPVDLLPALEKINQETSPDKERIFNDLRFGGFLIYHTPRLKIFIDDRCPLYGELLFLYDFARRQNPGEIERWQKQYQFHYALVEAGSAFDLYLNQSPRWTLLGRCAAAALYGQD